MPHWISKEEAHQNITQETAGRACALCVLGEQKRWVLYESTHCVVLLPVYARQWGHVMVLLRRHVTAYTDVSFDEWTEANQWALQMAKRMEIVLRPRRCYVASLGAATEHPLTFPHIHLHVIPVYQESDTPSTILTTRHGVLTGTDKEFEQLLQTLLV